MEEARCNVQYLPDFPFPENITLTASLEKAIVNAGLVIFVVPSQVMRTVVKTASVFLNPEVPICCASKGVESGTLMTMEEVLRDVLSVHFHAQLTFLAGPSFAKEVAAGLPTTIVTAARFSHVADKVAEVFHHGMFRAYYTDDIVGAELGGALKNVVAIACGAAEGCGLGFNARAGLMTRGLAEITRLAVKLGANPLTMSGLAGMGDLVLTCTASLSRNQRVGYGLGQGKKLHQVLTDLGQVAEGVYTAKSARNLAIREGVEMPVVEQMYQMLYEDKSVEDVLRDLFSRERRAERDRH
jgi:glycerol-3-phosphate dehydrogenase (NAD(P)+)